MKIKNEQPVFSIDTPAIFGKLDGCPNIWTKKCGVFFTGANKKSFRTEPPLYRLLGIYTEVEPDTPGAEKITTYDPETFTPIEHWFVELPDDGGAYCQNLAT